MSTKSYSLYFIYKSNVSTIWISEKKRFYYHAKTFRSKVIFTTFYSIRYN